MTSYPSRPAEIIEIDEREATEDMRSISSHPTEIAHSHTQGEPSTIGFIDCVQTRAYSRALTITVGSRNQIQPIEQILGRFDPTLVTSRDAQHLGMSSLSLEALHMAEELATIKTQLSAEATLIGRDLRRIDDTMDTLEVETQRVQEEFAARVAQRLKAADSQQLRYEEVTSQLHGAVIGEGQQAMARDLLLDEEIQRIQQGHQDEMRKLKERLQQSEAVQASRDNELDELR